MSFAGFNNLLSFCVKNILWFGYRGRHRTHYDILKLSKNCTTKEIKESYIKLSKQCHPDVNKDKESHEKFVQIGEAYRILSKPRSRTQYDIDLSSVRNNRHIVNPSYNPWHDESIFTFRSRAQYQSGPYYGFNGINRLPNSYIVVICLIAASLGIAVEVYMIKSASRQSRVDMDRKSSEAENQLQSARSEAKLYGKDAQIERMRARLDKQPYYKQPKVPAAVVVPDEGIKPGSNNVEENSDTGNFVVMANDNDGENVGVNVQLVQNVHKDEEQNKNVTSIHKEKRRESDPKNILAIPTIINSESIVNQYAGEGVGQYTPLFMYDLEKIKYNEEIDDYLEYIYNLDVMD